MYQEASSTEACLSLTPLRSYEVVSCQKKNTSRLQFSVGVLNWCVVCNFRIVSHLILTCLQLQAFFLVSDDMMDQSITRRDQPCWYRVPGVQNIAINDSFMLEAPIYHLIKSHFRQESYYVNLLELFHEVTYLTEMGQLVDLITAPEDHVDLNKFSLERCAPLLIGNI